MPRVWISIGSNIDREKNIRGAVSALREAYGALDVSPVYESEAVGFEGGAFLNLVVGFFTNAPVVELTDHFRTIEDLHGRIRSGNKFSSRTLDIDLLTYGDRVLRDGDVQIPRQEITDYAFVLRPLAEVAGDDIHPLTGRSYKELWQAFDRQDQPMRRIDLDF